MHNAPSETVKKHISYWAWKQPAMQAQNLFRSMKLSCGSGLACYSSMPRNIIWSIFKVINNYNTICSNIADMKRNQRWRNRLLGSNWFGLYQILSTSIFTQTDSAWNNFWSGTRLVRVYLIQFKFDGFNIILWACSILVCFLPNSCL